MGLNLNNIPSLDISNFLDRYQYESNIIYSPYVKPFLHAINTLINNSQTIPMTQRYMYRPDYVSFDYYGTVNLWYMIMKVNNVYSIVNFNMPNIIVPNNDIVMSILSKYKANSEIKNPVTPVGG
ncbi:MAG: hypothetical protein ACPLX8_00130 [Nanopusillaceae archaeon]|jgi:hypothetical protein